MTLDGTYTATVDRIEDGLAVLLVESDGETLAERHVDETELPADVEAGTVCTVTFDDGDLADVVARPEETDARRERAREKFDRLSERLDDEEE